VTPEPPIRRPLLARAARHRWDEVRGQHQLVFPEGLLVLNAPAAAVVRLCDGRPVEDLIAALRGQFSAGDPAADVPAFLGRLAGKGLVRDAADP
jgi:pyrroloquinoline quinone biosynthesis protein D